jgi:predicted acylesterase/phospholipase RssA
LLCHFWVFVYERIDAVIPLAFFLTLHFIKKKKENMKAYFLKMKSLYKKKMAERNTIATINTLCIPGGFMKSIALLGVISSLEDIGMLSNVTIFVGTSVGAVIGFLLSIGYNSEEILLSAFKNLIGDVQSYLMKSIQELGSRKFFMENDFIVKHIETMIISKGLDPSITLEQHHNITRKVIICTSYALDVKNENSGTKWHSYMTEPKTKCVDALRMSFSIPFFFDTMEVDRMLYIDGGLGANIPYDITDNDQSTLIVLVDPDNRDFGHRTVIKTPIRLQSLNLMLPINILNDIFNVAKFKTRIKLIKEKAD